MTSETNFLPLFVWVAACYSLLLDSLAFGQLFIFSYYYKLYMLAVLYTDIIETDLLSLPTYPCILIVKPLQYI